MPHVWSPVKVIAADHPRTGQAGVVVKSDYTPAAAALADAERLAEVATALERQASVLEAADEAAAKASFEAREAATKARAEADAAAAAEGKAKDQSPVVDVRFDAVGDSTEQAVESVRVSDLVELL